MEDFKSKITTYFKGVKAEWGKIVWPDKTQIKIDLFWVIGVSTIFTIIIYLLDIGFEALLSNLNKFH